MFWTNNLFTRNGSLYCIVNQFAHIQRTTEGFVIKFLQWFFTAFRCWKLPVVFGISYGTWFKFMCAMEETKKTTVRLTRLSHFSTNNQRGTSTCAGLVAISLLRCYISSWKYTMTTVQLGLLSILSGLSEDLDYPKMVVSSLTSSKYWDIGKNHRNWIHLWPNNRLSQKQNEFIDVFTMVHQTSDRPVTSLGRVFWGVQIF